MRRCWGKGSAKDIGDIDATFAAAARIVEANYEWPFQSHASMGPACAVVEVKDGGATLWTGSQKPHFAADGVAAMLGLPKDKVRGVWVPGPWLVRPQRRRRRGSRCGR